MKLSVIIPCYNKSSYLIEMIKSIQCQTFTDWELILVDDGSEEEQFEQIVNYVSCDHRIQLVKRNRLPKNGDTCRNIGMDLAKGEYLLIFDADDIVVNTCFERRVSFMDNHPNCDYASFPSCSFINGTDNYRPRAYYNSKATILEQLLSNKYPFTVWGNIYRKESLKNIRWDENLFVYQDFDFMVQCELFGLRHCWSNPTGEADYCYRIFNDGNSVCQKIATQDKVESTNYLFVKVIEQLKKTNDEKKLKTIFFRYILIHFEQLLLAYNQQLVGSFLETVKKIYPNQYQAMNNISVWRNKHNNSSHLTNAKLYLKLFYSFKEPVHKTFMIHEIGKWLLNR